MSKSPKHPQSLQKSAAPIFGAGLVRGEDRRSYSALHQAFTDDLKPSDPIETAFTQTAVDHSWAALRWRTIEARLLADPAQKDPVRERSVGAIDPPAALREGDNRWLDLIRKSMTGTVTPTRVDRLGEPLEDTGTGRRRRKRTVPSVTNSAEARTTLLTAFQKYGTALELVVRLRIRAEAQRDAAIRDLVRYRASTLRCASCAIEDAEFTEVKADGIKPETRSQPAQRTKEHRSPQSNRARPRKSQRA